MCEESITGIILSGGRGSRIEAEKGLVQFNGKPLIQYALDILSPVCSNILISANNQLDTYHSFGHQIVEDEVKNIGPLGGLGTCLKMSSTRFNCVITCDMPFVPSALFTHLLKQIENFQAAIPQHNQFFEPLCGIYATNVIWHLQKSIENKQLKVLDFIRSINTRKVLINKELSFYREEMFVNINTKADLNHNAVHE